MSQSEYDIETTVRKALRNEVTNVHANDALLDAIRRRASARPSPASAQRWWPALGAAAGLVLIVGVVAALYAAGPAEDSRVTADQPPTPSAEQPAATTRPPEDGPDDDPNGSPAEEPSPSSSAPPSSAGDTDACEPNEEGETALTVYFLNDAAGDVQGETVTFDLEIDGRLAMADVTVGPENADETRETSIPLGCHRFTASWNEFTDEAEFEFLGAQSWVGVKWTGDEAGDVGIVIEQYDEAPFFG